MAREKASSSIMTSESGICGTWKYRVYCAVTVTCCWLIHCTLGFSYSFGNINPYLTSYLRNLTTGREVDYTDTLWISQTSNIASNAIIAFAGLLSTRMHTKLYLFLGLVLNAITMFGMYWSVQASLGWTIVTYGVFNGVTHAILYPAPLNIVTRWIPQRAGFISGLILTGYGIGAFFWNFLITWYINPHNLQPDLRVGDDVFYTQPDVLDKVPGCFLVLGGIFLSIQVLATVLVCDAPVAFPQTDVKERPINDTETETLVDSEEVEHGSVGLSDPLGSDRERLEIEEGDEPHVQDTDQYQYHPKELLKSRVFWTLWFCIMMGETGSSFAVNLFKAYGQTFIADDHFLSLVASFSSVFNAAGRPFWGLLADRIGPRMVALIALTVLACLLGSFLTCEVAGRVFFFVWVCGMFLVMCGFFTMVPTFAYRLFGSQHFNANLGLLYTQGIIGSLMSTLLAPVLKNLLGWHGMFYFSFGAVFVGLLLNMSLDIPCGNTIPQHMYRDLALLLR